MQKTLGKWHTGKTGARSLREAAAESGKTGVQPQSEHGHRRGGKAESNESTAAITRPRRAGVGHRHRESKLPATSLHLTPSPLEDSYLEAQRASDCISY